MMPSGRSLAFRRLIVLAAALAVAVTWVSGAQARAGSARRVTLIVVNGADVHSWRHQPEMARLLREGSAALLVGGVANATFRAAVESTLLGAPANAGVTVLFADGGRAVPPAAAADLVARMREAMEPGDLLLVASAVPSAERIRARIPLGVVAMVGRGVPPGLLSSPSTRRAGVVSLNDLAPTILEFAGVRIRGEIRGRPMTFEAQPRSSDRLAALDRALSHAARVRDPLMRWLVYAAATILGAAALSLALGRRPRRLPVVLLWVAALPLALLVVVPFPAFPPLATAALAAAIATIVSLTLSRVLNPMSALGVVGGITAGLVLVDVSIGAPLAARAPISYVVARGDRFYGIGNELMGVSIGAVLVAVAAVLASGRAGRPVRRALPWILSVFVMAMALPQLGAKFGSVLTAVPAFGVLVVRAFGRRTGLARAAAIGAVTFMGAAGLVAIDRLSAPEARSHIGAISSAGLGRVLSSKAQAAARLVGFSYWMVALIVVGACVALLVVRRREEIRSVGRACPPIAAGLHGGVVGMIAAVLFNDAGLIAAVLIGMFLLCLLLCALFRYLPAGVATSSRSRLGPPLSPPYASHEPSGTRIKHSVRTL